MRSLFLLLTAAALTAGGQPPPDKKDKDPQSKFEPRSGPGAGQKYLERYVGEWAVEKSFFPRNGGDPSVSRGSCKQEMIHGGRFLKSEFTFDGPNGPTTGTGVIGFEPESGRFTSSWIDSRQTRMSFRQSKDKFGGEEIVLFGQELGTDQQARRSKTVTRLEAGGAKVVHRQFSIAADGTERLVMQLQLTRKPAAPAKSP
ncbi:MAG: DUF1579 family protein [Gemmataceae bacterium]